MRRPADPIYPPPRVAHTPRTIWMACFAALCLIAAGAIGMLAYLEWTAR